MFRPLPVSVLLLACTGNVGGSAPGGPGMVPGTSPPGSTPGGPPPTGMVAPASVSAAAAPLRRLSNEQYRNTVRDLLGISDAVAPSALPGDDAVADRFFSNVASPLKPIDVDRYADAADALAARAVANLAALVPCDAQAPDCATKFITSFGRRAYRRPLTAPETERLKMVFAAGKDFPDGIRLVITALLQSPKFLYLPEPVPANAAGKVVSVDSWAMASRLSYFLLNTMPDDALLLAAEQGQLTTADQVAKQAARLMSDPRFKQMLGSFHGQWLELANLAGAEKDAKLFPTWTPALKAALAEESRRFVESVMTDGDGKLATLLTAPYSFLSGPLYDLYGVKPPATATTWQRTDLDKNQRAGLLTQAGLLATLAHENRTSFILRGKLIREALFCATIPPPPPEVPDTDSKLPVGATAQERAAAHRDRPECKTCHELFDPLGFAFESYDAIGRYRTTEANGQPVDTRVMLTGTARLDGPVANAVELAQKLASADEVRDCVARQWMRFALGRNDSADDAPSLTLATKAFGDSGGKVSDLLVALARSDAFRYQKVVP
jgi:hypothetical protein